MHVLSFSRRGAGQHDAKPQLAPSPRNPREDAKSPALAVLPARCSATSARQSTSIPSSPKQRALTNSDQPTRHSGPHRRRLFATTSAVMRSTAMRCPDAHFAQSSGTSGLRHTSNSIAPLMSCFVSLEMEGSFGSPQRRETTACSLFRTCRLRTGAMVLEDRERRKQRLLMGSGAGSMRRILSRTWRCSCLLREVWFFVRRKVLRCF